MLYREIIAVCSQIHTKHINTLCGQNAESLDLKADRLQQVKVWIRSKVSCHACIY